LDWGCEVGNNAIRKQHVLWASKKKKTACLMKETVCFCLEQKNIDRKISNKVGAELFEHLSHVSSILKTL
jgi:hypothetical protein